MRQCHLGRRFSALPRRDIIITATAKAESSFAGTGRPGRAVGSHSLTVCLAAPRPKRLAAPISGRDAVARRDRTGPPVQPTLPRGVRAMPARIAESALLLDSRLRARRAKINGGGAGFAWSMARRPNSAAYGTIARRDH